MWPVKRPADVVLNTRAKMVQERGQDGILRILKVPVPTLEKFETKDCKQDKVIIVCPGGSYTRLIAEYEGSEVAEWLNSLGYTAYMLRYRVPDNRDGALQDAQRAIRIVRSENPGKKIGIMGFSAGGSLSARAGTRFDIQSYKPVDGIDKQSARPDFVCLIYPAYLDDGPNRTLSPELTVSRNTPPMFIFQTEDDDLCNSSLVMAQALRAVKVPVEVHMYPEGGHGYGIRPSRDPIAAVWPKLLENWLFRLKSGEE